MNLEGEPSPMAEAPARAVLCLGNFDGVHVAHRALLEEGRALAARLEAEDGIPCACGVFCFLLPSTDYVGRGNTHGNPHPTHLTPLNTKLRLFSEAGVDFVCLCDFPTVRDLAPADFISLLRERCGCVGVACGFNHRFGRNAGGTPATLTAALGEGRVICMPEMTVDGMTVSSSRIRHCLQHGDMETAARLLGRPYSMESDVVKGKQLGRTIGFPTANQYFPAESIIPARGVYAVLGHTPLGTFPGVANVGAHPTVDEVARVNCETHFLGLSHDLYGKRVKLEFLHFLRTERTFDSLEDLTATIRADAETVRRYMAERA